MLKEKKNIINKAKKSISLFILIAVTSCSTNNFVSLSNNQKILVNNNEYIVNVSNNVKGGEITVKLGFSNLQKFFTKANTNGSPAKTPLDIKSYKLYLIKNSNATYPLGGDPLSDSVYTFTINSLGTYMNTVKFKGITGSGANYYYVGVIAYDGLNGTGNELIKPNNGNTIPWSSASANIGIAVSSGNGINVNDSTLVASPDYILSITSNLIDAVGATIDVDSTVVSGANSGALELINIPVTYRNIATDITLNQPNDVAIDSSGNVYIADTTNNLILKHNQSTNITSIIAGGGTNTLSNIAATDAQLYSPNSIAVDSSGNVYISESNDKVRKITSGGVIQDFAGTGSFGNSGDGGQATNAQLNLPKGLYIDSTNKVYIADSINKRIRVVDTSSGVITTYAGGGSSLGDSGNATDAEFLSPIDVSGDSSGNIFVADNGNYRIRKINSSGVITTYAGVGFSGNTNNGSQATTAQINPDSLHTDKYGNVYFSDMANNIIRKVNIDGVISLFAGSGISTSTVGVATTLSIGEPTGISSDSSGNIYFSDKNSNIVRKVF